MSNIFIPATNIYSVISSIEDFHLKVEKLSLEQPTTKLGLLHREFSSISLDASNKNIRDKVKTVTRLAQKILHFLPEECRNREIFREKLKDKNFAVGSPDKIVIPHPLLSQFLNDMDRLFKEIYPEVELSPFSKLNKMPKIVQEFLSADLKRLRSEKKTLTKAHDPEHRTQRKIAKGKLAIELRHGIKENKGAMGTFIIKDVNGKPVGVHKVSEKDVPLFIRIKNILKSFFGGQLTYLSRKNLAQPRSERAAYLVSHLMGFHVVPPSAETTLQKKAGVFQVFVSREKKSIVEKKDKSTTIDHSIENLVKYPKNKGPNDYLEAKHVIDHIDSKFLFTNSEKIKAQLFFIFDYLIGNLDRHEENWFVTVSPNNEITNIKAIDNANAFPQKQPTKDSMAVQNQYKWQLLNIAKQPFTQETVDFVRKNLNLEQVKKIIEKIKNDLPEFLDPNMENLFVLRAKMIFKFVQETKQTPAGLASYSTQDEIEAYLTTRTCGINHH